jgi:uncharacterized protein YciI
MKYILLYLTVLMLGTIPLKAQDINPGYDSTLAKKLGGDDYGMKRYVLVILKTGTNEVKDSILRDSLFAGHFANINRLADEGKLIVAGPLAKNNNSYRGIFILSVATAEEANALLAADPTIKENIFAVELYQWYGSAALPEYLEVHKKIEKFQVK